MRKIPFKICNETIHPGERLSLALPLPELFSCAPMYMPIKVIRGKKPGPCLLVIAAMRGNELNGAEIINRLWHFPSLRHIQGTLIMVPVMNVYGMINRSRYLPGNINFDHSFPGSSLGSHAERLAYIFGTEILAKADGCIHLQTGLVNYTSLPQIYVNFNDEKAKQLAKVFGAPVISDVPIEKGSLRALTARNKIPLLVYEAGEAMRLDEHAVRVGMKGTLHVMNHLNMLSEQSQRLSKLSKHFFTKGNIWVHAANSGVYHSKIKLGQHVNEGQPLCVIKDPFGTSGKVTITCPQEGIIVGKNNLPLLHEGEKLYQIAVFSETKAVASHLQSWEARSLDESEEFAQS